MNSATTTSLGGPSGRPTRSAENTPRRDPAKDAAERGANTADRASSRPRPPAVDPSTTKPKVQQQGRRAVNASKPAVPTTRMVVRPGDRGRDGPSTVAGGPRQARGPLTGNAAPTSTATSAETAGASVFRKASLTNKLVPVTSAFSGGGSGVGGLAGSGSGTGVNPSSSFNAPFGATPPPRSGAYGTTSGPSTPPPQYQLVDATKVHAAPAGSAPVSEPSPLRGVGGGGSVRSSPGRGLAGSQSREMLNGSSAPPISGGGLSITSDGTATPTPRVVVAGRDGPSQGGRSLSNSHVGSPGVSTGGGTGTQDGPWEESPEVIPYNPMQEYSPPSAGAARKLSPGAGVTPPAQHIAMAPLYGPAHGATGTGAGVGDHKNQPASSQAADGRRAASKPTTTANQPGGGGVGPSGAPPSGTTTPVVPVPPPMDFASSGASPARRLHLGEEDPLCSDLVPSPSASSQRGMHDALAASALARAHGAVSFRGAGHRGPHGGTLASAIASSTVTDEPLAALNRQGREMNSSHRRTSMSIPGVPYAQVAETSNRHHPGHDTHTDEKTSPVGGFTPRDSGTASLGRSGRATGAVGVGNSGTFNPGSLRSVPSGSAVAMARGAGGRRTSALHTAGPLGSKEGSEERRSQDRHSDGGSGARGRSPNPSHGHPSSSGSPSGSPSGGAASSSTSPQPQGHTHQQQQQQPTLPKRRFKKGSDAVLAAAGSPGPSATGGSFSATAVAGRSVTSTGGSGVGAGLVPPGMNTYSASTQHTTHQLQGASGDAAARHGSGAVTAGSGLVLPQLQAGHGGSFGEARRAGHPTSSSPQPKKDGPSPSKSTDGSKHDPSRKLSEKERAFLALGKRGHLQYHDPGPFETGKKPKDGKEKENTPVPVPGPPRSLIRVPYNEAPLWQSKEDELPFACVGLQNLGNTCFMNSTLQCLLRSGPVRAWLHDPELTSDVALKSLPRNSPVLQTLRDLALDMLPAPCTDPQPTKAAQGRAGGGALDAVRKKGGWCDDKKMVSVVAPREFKSAFGKVCTRFSGYQQHDAQEFLRCLVERVHDEATPRPGKATYRELDDIDGETPAAAALRWWTYFEERGPSPLHDIFAGQLHGSKICGTCNFNSPGYDMFYDVSVPIVPGSRRGEVSLERCLHEYVRPVPMTGMEQVYCSRCKTHRDGHVQLQFLRLPPVLVIHLVRFKESAGAGGDGYMSRKMSFGLASQSVRTKNGDLVRFPVPGGSSSVMDLLDMAPYLSPAAGDEERRKSKYVLRGVVNHMGSCHGGHYTAFGAAGDIAGAAAEHLKTYKNSAAAAAAATASSSRLPEGSPQGPGSPAPAPRLDIPFVEYNDSSTHLVPRAKEVMTNAAYLLFYERLPEV